MDKPPVELIYYQNTKSKRDAVSWDWEKTPAQKAFYFYYV